MYSYHTHVGHDEGMLCDIFASEHGASCTAITQLPKLDLIHCMFVPDKVGGRRLFRKLIWVRRGFTVFPAPSSVIGPAPKHIISDYEHHPSISLNPSKLMKPVKRIENETIPAVRSIWFIP